MKNSGEGKVDVPVNGGGKNSKMKNDIFWVGLEVTCISYCCLCIFLPNSSPHKLISPTSHRTIAFHPDGDCVYAGSPDVLKVYGWEPARTFDTVAMGWGKIQDIAIAQNQLVSLLLYVQEGFFHSTEGSEATAQFRKK